MPPKNRVVLTVYGLKLGKDPELKASKNKGTSVCEFSAVLSRGPDKSGIWFQFVAFKEMAEYIAANFRKGDRIDIAESTPDLSEWTKDGQKRSLLKWVVWSLSNESGQAGAAPGDEGRY
ncbi:MAG: single-stranded DNA-binding protein [Syntrophobacteraceae bacterium]